MPPFAAACPWAEEDDSVQSQETGLQEAQLSDWLAQGEAYPSKSLGGAEAAVILKVFSQMQPESVSDLLHPAPFAETLLWCRLT